MTFKRFEELLKTKYPTAEAEKHGDFAGTTNNNKVAIVFTPNGKVYCYYGSYQNILNRLGIKCVYLSDIKQAKIRLKMLKETHGKPNKFSLFSNALVDHSAEIIEWENYLKRIDNGEFIII